MWSEDKRKVFASTQGLSLPPDRPEDTTEYTRDGNISTGISAGIKTVSEK